MNRKIALPILIASVLFICLTFDPMSTYIFGKWLPGIFNVVQNSYRLLVFVSLLSAISIAIAAPKLNKNIIYILTCIILSSQIPLIWKFISLVNQDKVAISEILGSPINAYYSTPKTLNRIRTETGFLDDDNLFSLAPENIQTFSLRIKGRTDLPKAGDHPEVFVAAVMSDKPLVITPLTNIVPLENNFDIIFDAIHPSAEMKIFRLVVRDKYSGKPVPIVPQGFYLYEGLKNRYITEDSLSRNIAGPYVRKFEVKKEFLNKNQLFENGEWIFELPIVYSPLFIAYQNGVLLKPFVDFNHRMRVSAPSWSDPIYVQYNLSFTVILLTIFGVLGFIFLIYWDALIIFWRRKLL